MRTTLTVLLCCAISSAGCYHTTINTGATPSTETIDKPFASSFVYGLVPPATVEAATTCTSGVARVETQQSFVNGLVAIITLGIYTPVTIKVTCAAKKVAAGPAASADFTVAAEAEGAAIRDTFSKAADRAVLDGKLVLVRVTYSPRDH